MDSARHAIGCSLSQETRVRNAFEDVASAIHPSAYPKPGLMDSTRHVVGCHLTQETRVQNAFADVASTICARHII